MIILHKLCTAITQANEKCKELHKLNSYSQYFYGLSRAFLITTHPDFDNIHIILPIGVGEGLKTLVDAFDGPDIAVELIAVVKYDPSTNTIRASTTLLKSAILVVLNRQCHLREKSFIMTGLALFSSIF